MRTSRQVAVYCVLPENGKNFYILLKRNKNRGGFWQPITGGEENFDNGDLLKTAIRETREELGIDIAESQIVEIPHSFKFIDQEGVEHTEKCFGTILPLEAKGQIRLSDEHTAILYGTDLDYLKSLLKFEDNRIGLEKFSQWMTNHLGNQ